MSWYISRIFVIFNQIDVFSFLISRGIYPGNLSIIDLDFILKTLCDVMLSSANLAGGRPPLSKGTFVSLLWGKPQLPLWVNSDLHQRYCWLKCALTYVSESDPVSETRYSEDWHYWSSTRPGIIHHALTPLHPSPHPQTAPLARPPVQVGTAPSSGSGKNLAILWVHLKRGPSQMLYFFATAEHIFHQH